MTPEELVAFVRQRAMGVVATRGPDGAPQAALVGLASTDSCEILFDTSRRSRKYRSLLARAEVALVVGFDNEVTVQVEGVADVVSDSEQSRCWEVYLRSHPDGRQRADDPDVVLIRVRPTWLRHSDYRAMPPMILETAL